MSNRAKLLVRMGRLELPRPCERWNLNPVRLPIPPHPLAERNCFRVTFRVNRPRAPRPPLWSLENSETPADCA
jgi:hypothetical protein